MLACAIKGVYASVFYRDSKAYMTATSNVIDQEKMAVILQQVVGKDYGDQILSDDEWCASLPQLLSDWWWDGGGEVLPAWLSDWEDISLMADKTLRVCPYTSYPSPADLEMEMALRDTQTQFYALDMKHVGEDFKVDDGFNLLKLQVKDAVEDHESQLHRLYFRPIRSGHQWWRLWDGT